MADFKEYCRRAVEAVGHLIRIEGAEVLGRRDEYGVSPDFSLTLVRDLQLRWPERNPLWFFETGLWTHVATPLEEVDFEVEVTGGSRRTAFALPCIAQSTPTHARFVVGLVPPMTKGEGTLGLRLRWRWPRWWERLDKEGVDAVTVDIRSTGRYEFTLKYPYSLGLTITSNPPHAAKETSKGDFLLSTHTYDAPADGRYVFTCRRPRDAGAVDARGP